MAYETGSASGVNDLLDKLRIFALAQGWTVDFNGTRTDAAGNALLMNKAGLCVAFLSDTTSAGSTSNPANYVQVYTYPGPYSGAVSNTNQTGKTGTSTANRLAGPYTAYHFVSGATYLHVIVETAPGRFSHFGAGVLDKAGGGGDVAYSYGLGWSFDPLFTNNATTSQHSIPFDANTGSGSGGGIRADGDGIAPRNYSLNVNGTSRAVGGFTSTGFGLAHHMMRVGPSALTGRATLAPAIVMVERTSGVFSVAGAPRDFRFVRIDNIAPGEVITIGADQWKCFPIVRKNGPAGVENSANYGFAYRVA